MKPDYGPTVVLVIGMFAIVAVLIGGFVLPLLSSVGQRLAAVAS